MLVNREAADDTYFVQWRSASACDYLSNTSWLWNSCTGSPNQHDVVVDALLLPAILTSVVEKVAALGLNFLTDRHPTAAPMPNIAADVLMEAEAASYPTILLPAITTAGRLPSGSLHAMLRFKPSISKRTATHRHCRRNTLALTAALQAHDGGWLTTLSLSIRLSVARMLERRARHRLVNAVPANSEEAREKFQYIIAFLIADGDDIPPRDIEKVIDTLRQFRLDISAYFNRDIFSKNV